MIDLHFTDDGWEAYLYWQMQDKKTLKRLNALIKETSRTPFEGTGKPEPLKGDLSGKWSRRINGTDRLVYDYIDGILTIYQCHTHYKDS